jgi:acyl phosphate:glycerol-3-phosphate acyltransferase
VTARLIGLIAAYLLGSIPWAYIAGRLLKGIDLRRHGSGNLGATNVWRILGLPAALAVLLLDAGKGAIAVFLLPNLFNFGGSESLSASLEPSRVVGGTAVEYWAIAYGAAAILGHVRSIFLGWRGGGKGVATAAGAFAVLAPLPLTLAFVVFATVLAVTRVMSLGSLIGAAALPLAVGALRGVTDPVFFLALAVAAFVGWTHRSNIGRLWRGEEPRLGQKPSA